MKPNKGMTVGYIDASGKKKKATVTNVHSETYLTLDHTSESENNREHTADAHFDPKKKKTNSWHFLSDGNGAAASESPKKKPATPAAPANAAAK